MTTFIDPSDGVFVNVGGHTGEMVTDPNTGELKVVIGSSQPVAGGAGGPTQYNASGGPGSAVATNTLVNLLQNTPVWTFPALVFLGIFAIAALVLRGK